MGKLVASFLGSGEEQQVRGETVKYKPCGKFGSAHGHALVLCGLIKYDHKGKKKWSNLFRDPAERDYFGVKPCSLWPARVEVWGL